MITAAVKTEQHLEPGAACFDGRQSSGHRILAVEAKLALCPATRDGVDGWQPTQALRYRVFYREMGAAHNLRSRVFRVDIDRFDRACDHLLVVDRSRRKIVPPIFGSVVGTCRLMRRSVALRRVGFYSAGEFDLGPLLERPDECLELGRSCVAPDYRSRAVIDGLWGGIAQYVTFHGIGMMFGCASLPGTDPDRLAAALSYLHHFHLAPAACRPRAVAGRFVAMDRLPADAIDPRAVAASLPPLLKGYLRLGAKVGEGAVVDHAFNTTDVCIVLETERVAAKYLRHFGAHSADREAA